MSVINSDEKSNMANPAKINKILCTSRELKPTSKEKDESKIEDQNSKKYSFRRVTKIILDDVQNEYLRACFKIFNTDFIVVKLFLIIFIFLSTSLAAFLIIETILSFLSYEVNTTTRVMQQTTSEFPKITLCNYSPFTTKDSIVFLRKINQETWPDIDVFDETQLNSLNYTFKSKVIYDVYNAANLAMFKLTDDEKKRLGHKLEDILISCSFNGELCTHDDFTWKFDTFFGNCFVFNDPVKSGEPTKRSYIAGSLYGLAVQFYIGFNERLKLFNSNSMKGAYIRIENSSYYSDDLLDNGIYISPGKSTSALINRLVNYVLPKPYSLCDLDNESGIKNVEKPFVKLFYHSKYQYTQQSCIIQCMQSKSIKKCNCTYPLYFSLFDADYCMDGAQLECYGKVWEEFLGKNYVQVKFKKI